MKKQINLVALLLTLMTCALAQADIVVGQSVALTGTASLNGKAIAAGANIYFAKVNAAGGVNGQHIKLLSLDDGGDGPRALENTQTLIERDKAVVLTGYYSSVPMLEILKSRVLETSGVPLIGCDSGAENIRAPGSPYLFHIRAGYTAEINHIVSLLHDHLGIKSYAVLAQQDNFGKTNVEAIKTALGKYQLKLVDEQWYDKATGDIHAAVPALIKSHPDAIILVATSKPAAAFVQQFKAAGGISQLYGLSQIQYNEVVRMAGATAATGLGLSQVFPSPGDWRLKLVSDFQKDAKAALTDDVPQYALLEGYLSAKVVTEALRRAGPNPTPGRVYAALNNMHKVDLGGFVVDFAEGNRLGSKFVELTMISPSGVLAR